MRLLLGAAFLASLGAAGVPPPPSPPTENNASVAARLHLVAVCPQITRQCGVPTTVTAQIPDLIAALNCMLKVNISSVPAGDCHDALALLLSPHSTQTNSSSSSDSSDSSSSGETVPVTIEISQELPDFLQNPLMMLEKLRDGDDDGSSGKHRKHRRHMPFPMMGRPPMGRPPMPFGVPPMMPFGGPRPPMMFGSSHHGMPPAPWMQQRPSMPWQHGSSRSSMPPMPWHHGSSQHSMPPMPWHHKSSHGKPSMPWHHGSSQHSMPPMPWQHKNSRHNMPPMPWNHGSSQHSMPPMPWNHKSSQHGMPPMPWQHKNSRHSMPPMPWQHGSSRHSKPMGKTHHSFPAPWRHGSMSWHSSSSRSSWSFGGMRTQSKHHSRPPFPFPPSFQHGMPHPPKFGGSFGMPSKHHRGMKHSKHAMPFPPFGMSSSRRMPFPFPSPQRMPFPPFGMSSRGMPPFMMSRQNGMSSRVPPMMNRPPMMFMGRPPMMGPMGQVPPMPPRPVSEGDSSSDYDYDYSSSSESTPNVLSTIIKQILGGKPVTIPSVTGSSEESFDGSIDSVEVSAETTPTQTEIAPAPLGDGKATKVPEEVSYRRAP